MTTHGGECLSPFGTQANSHETEQTEHSGTTAGSTLQAHHTRTAAAAAAVAAAKRLWAHPNVAAPPEQRAWAGVQNGGQGSQVSQRQAGCAGGRGCPGLAGGPIGVSTHSPPPRREQEAREEQEGWFGRFQMVGSGASSSLHARARTRRDAGEGGLGLALLQERAGLA